MSKHPKRDRRTRLSYLFLPTRSTREKVNRFKALVIGGGGFFRTKYTQVLFGIETFSERLTLPVIVIGAAARWVIVVTPFHTQQGASREAERGS